MDLWYIKRPKRFMDEYELINKFVSEEEKIISSEWKLQNDIVMFFCALRIGDEQFPMKIQYPFFFPFVPISITQNYPDGKVRQWTDHQYLNGTLCLEYGPDNWTPNITGKMVLQSAVKLLETENRGEVVESREQFTTGQILRNIKHRLVVNESFIKHLKAPGKFYIAKFYENNVSVYHPLCIDDSKSPIFVGRNLMKYNFSLRKGYFFGDKIDPQVLQNIQEEAREHELILLWGTGDRFSAAVLKKDAEKEESLDSHVKILYLNDDRQRNPYGKEDLKKKKVAIIGLGSLGSKIADSLARTGVEEFMLIDGDVFIDKNIQRHVLIYDSVGFLKTEAIETHLKRINHNVKVSRVEMELGTMESTAYYNRITAELSKCDVVIDATADSQCFSILANLTEIAGVPLVWGKVYAGGLGGYVAHSNNINDGGPLFVNQTYENFTFENLYPRENKATDYSEIIGNVTYVASDADVSIIASWMAQIVLNLFMGNNNFPKPVYIIGFKKEWIFSYAGQMIGVDSTEKPLELNVEPDTDSLMEAKLILDLITYDESDYSP